jgi:glutathione S-transferase
VTLAALLLVFWTMYRVGKARVEHKVKAPVVDGPEDFQRVMRVQINTIEQLVLFLPSLWLCAVYLGDRWAAPVGVIWIIGRVMYALGYYREAGKRSAGFGVAAFSTATLMVGTVSGLLLGWLH